MRTEGGNTRRPESNSNGNSKRFGDSPKPNGNFRSSSKPGGFSGAKSPRKPRIA